jgi:hypothetical protein
MRNIPFKYTDGGREADGFSHEKKDCTVRTLATICEMPYSTAHAILKEAGRLDKGKFPIRRLLEYGIADYIFTPVSLPVRVPCTVNQVCKRFTKGSYIIRIRKHVFALIDGTQYDEWENGKKKRVINIWKVRVRG